MAVRQSIEIPRNALRRMFFQRCFWLFLLLLALITISPFVEGLRVAWLLSGFNAFIVLSAAAAVGRTALSFLAVFCLIGGAVGLRYASLDMGDPAGAVLLPAATTTDSSGLASAQVQLGLESGEQEIVARVTGTDLSASFTATATSGGKGKGGKGGHGDDDD